MTLSLNAQLNAQAAQVILGLEKTDLDFCANRQAAQLLVDRVLASNVNPTRIFVKYAVANVRGVEGSTSWYVSFTIENEVLPGGRIQGTSLANTETLAITRAALDFWPVAQDYLKFSIATLKLQAARQAAAAHAAQLKKAARNA